MLSTTMIPRGGLVLLHVFEEEEEKTKEGLILPSLGSGGGTIFRRARVIKVGEGVTMDTGIVAGTSDLHVGQTVLVKYGEKQRQGTVTFGNFFTDDASGGRLFLTNESSIIVILNNGGIDDEPIKTASEQSLRLT